MDSDEFKKLFKLAVEKAFRGPSDHKGDMRLKRQTEADLKKAYKEHQLGLITIEELLDLEWYYFENWVDPIQIHSDFSLSNGLSPTILN